MSTKTPTGQESAGTTRTASNLPGVFGVDCRGALHRYNAVTETLVVTDQDNTVVHERDMTLDELRESWLPQIGRDRGWIDCWLDAEQYTDVVGRLGRAIKAANADDTEGDDR